MNKNAIKTIALVGILTALYFVASLTLKIPMGIGAIALDLGYIVLTLSAFKVGRWSAFVGGGGAAIESILLSPLWYLLWLDSNEYHHRLNLWNSF